MEVYRKIAAGETSEEELLAELTDRFGAPPAEVATLLEVGRLKRVAEALRVQAVSARGDRLTIRLRRDARVDVEKLIGMVSERPGASFSPTGVLTLTAEPGDAVGAARRTLEELAA
jgi:transcription-repair coupling factor (superfamily II helicase)